MRLYFQCVLGIKRRKDIAIIWSCLQLHPQKSLEVKKGLSDNEISNYRNTEILQVYQNLFLHLTYSLEIFPKFDWISSGNMGDESARVENTLIKRR